MEYKAFGKTGLKVSAIGFGGIPIQKGSNTLAKEVLHAAMEEGINYIDTARGYTVSESYIGEALEGIRDQWIIATKSMARTKEAMAKDVEISLENLRTNYIDLYQFHNIKNSGELETVLREDGAYAALVEAKSAGKIGHIGVTTHSADMLMTFIESGKFETIMFPYNIVESQGEKAFQAAYEKGIAIIAMKPMAGGAIEDKTLALRYIGKNPNVTIAIPGMGEISEVRENVAAIGNNSVLTREEERQIEKIKKELGEHFCRRCGYCGPCPQGIDIPSMFLFEGYKKRYALEGWAEERYHVLPKTAKDCVACGACETKCPYELPIREMLCSVKATFGE